MGRRGRTHSAFVARMRVKCVVTSCVGLESQTYSSRREFRNLPSAGLVREPEIAPHIFGEASSIADTYQINSSSDASH